MVYARNYLRIRGEESREFTFNFTLWELPPHTRRRVTLHSYKTTLSGITSAYAEKRCLCQPATNRRRNYLRMRGEEAAPMLLEFLRL